MSMWRGRGPYPVAAAAGAGTACGWWWWWCGWLALELLEQGDAADWMPTLPSSRLNRVLASFSSSFSAAAAWNEKQQRNQGLLKRSNAQRVGN